MPLSHRRLLNLVSATLALTACGCAVGGNGSENLGHTSLRPEKLLSAEELQSDCIGMKASVVAHATEIKKLRADMAVELKNPAPTLDRMFSRTSGVEGAGTLAFDKISAERRTMAALVERLQDKHCPVPDVERTIAGAPAPAPKPACADDIRMKYGKSSKSAAKPADCT